MLLSCLQLARLDGHDYTAVIAKFIVVLPVFAKCQALHHLILRNHPFTIAVWRNDRYTCRWYVSQIPRALDTLCVHLPEELLCILFIPLKAHLLSSLLDTACLQSRLVLCVCLCVVVVAVCAMRAVPVIAVNTMRAVKLLCAPCTLHCWCSVPPHACCACRVCRVCMFSTDKCHKPYSCVQVHPHMQKALTLSKKNVC